MRICYLCSDLGIPVGGRKGAAAHVRGLVGALGALGHQCEILTPRPDGAQAPPAPVSPVLTSALAEELGEGVPKTLGRALGHLWNNVAVEAALDRRLREWRPDLVYERYSPFSVAGGLVARRLAVPHVLEVNAPLAWEGTRYRSQALAEASASLERAAFANAGLIVAVSRELADTLEADGVARGKILVVPNGVDTERFHPEGPAAPVAGEFVIGFVGSLKPWHGIDVLTEAFGRLSADPRVHLLVVGQGPEARRIDALAQAMPGRVTRVSVDHERVPDYLRAMDVAVAPYPELESFYYSPLKVLEYMATGRAIVASAVGQVAELIDDGHTGLLVPPGDAPALTAALARVLEDSVLSERLAGNARLAARRAHTWTQRAEAILTAAAPLLARAGAGRWVGAGIAAARTPSRKTTRPAVRTAAPQDAAAGDGSPSDAPRRPTLVADSR